MWEKIKHIQALLDRKDIFTSLLIILVSGVSFVLGQLSALHKTPVPVTVQMVQNQEAVTNTASLINAMPPVSKEKVGAGKTVITASESPAQTPIARNYVASKSGTKYHLPNCPSAQKISEKNKIWFATKEEAEQAGYTPASNCKGI